METMLEFTVPAIPVAQPRPKATTVNGSARLYEAKKSHPVHAFKASVRMAFAEANAGRPPEAGPLGVTLRCVLPRPKSMIWKKRDMPRVWAPKKPDVDNLMKSVLDALAGLAFGDDAQICLCIVEKLICSGSEQPHVRVTLDRLDADDQRFWEELG
jgi:Holliday junction resolvase RusA-like endonuclease